MRDVVLFCFVLLFEFEFNCFCLSWKMSVWTGAKLHAKGVAFNGMFCFGVWRMTKLLIFNREVLSTNA
jgi:hypothetical protein